MAMETNYTRLK